MTIELSDRRSRIYTYIVNHKRTNDGLSPSIREISDALGLSLSITYGHLIALQRLGLISLLGNKERGIKIPGGVWMPPLEGDDDSKYVQTLQFQAKVIEDQSKEIDRLRSALEAYADISNWIISTDTWKGEGRARAIAQEALKDQQ